jgi:hypothetical protein
MCPNPKKQNKFHKLFIISSPLSDDITSVIVVNVRRFFMKAFKEKTLKADPSIAAESSKSEQKQVNSNSSTEKRKKEKARQRNPVLSTFTAWEPVWH